MQCHKQPDFCFLNLKSWNSLALLLLSVLLFTWCSHLTRNRWDQKESTCLGQMVRFEHDVVRNYIYSLRLNVLICDLSSVRRLSFLTLSESKHAMTRPLSTWQLLAGCANLHSWSEREHVPLWNSLHTSSVSHFVSRMCAMFNAMATVWQKVFRAAIGSGASKVPLVF